MTDHDPVVSLLREANPAPTQRIEERPSAAEMLMSVQPVGHRSVQAPARRRMAIAAVAAGFAAVVLAVLAVLPVGSEPAGEPTTVVPSSSTTTSSTVPAEAAAQIDPAVQVVLDEFASRYSAGDVAGVMDLLAPDAYKQTVRDAEEPYRWDPATMEYQIAIDAVLNTTVTIEGCRPLQSGSVACEMFRSNDLTDIAGIEPQGELVTFRVMDGQIVVWVERQGFHATPYQELAVAPFTEWLASAHPEIDDPHPLVGGVSRWRPDRPVLDELADLVAEYAAAGASSS